MAWRGRGRGRPGGFARHDITLKDDEQLSDVPQTFPPAPMPAKAPQQDDLEAETKRLLVRNKCQYQLHGRCTQWIARMAVAYPACLLPGSGPALCRYVTSECAKPFTTAPFISTLRSKTNTKVADLMSGGTWTRSLKRTQRQERWLCIRYVRVNDLPAALRSPHATGRSRENCARSRAACRCRL